MSNGTGTGYKKPRDEDLFPASITAADGKTELKRFRVDGVIFATTRGDAQNRANLAEIYLEAAKVDDDPAWDSFVQMFKGAEIQTSVDFKDATGDFKAGARAALDDLAKRLGIDLLGKPAKPEQQWVVRLYDGFDHEWMDVSDPMPKDEAEKLCRKKNSERSGSSAGKETGEFGDIDYYAIFESDTTMVFSEQGKSDLGQATP